jgi:choline dehydrogenase
MMWVRGCPQDYDRWAAASGEQGWSFSNLLPFWKEMENYDEGSDEYRGRNGPIVVRQQSRVSSGFRSIVESFVKAGFKEDDYNGPSHTNVVSHTQENNGNGIRW